MNEIGNATAVVMKPKPLSLTMQSALAHACNHGAKLIRFPGGFWAAEGWVLHQGRWFGTSTVEALVARGRMEYTKWQAGKRGRFPVEASVAQISDYGDSFKASE